MLQHNHLIVRAEIDNPPKDTKEVELWFSQLVSDLGMKTLYGPVAVYSELKNNEGMTGFVILTTSHAAFHTWDAIEQPVMQLDIYTCSNLDLNVAWRALEQFEPVHVEYKFLDREFGLVEINS